MSVRQFLSKVKNALIVSGEVSTAQTSTDDAIRLWLIVSAGLIVTLFGLVAYGDPLAIYKMLWELMRNLTECPASQGDPFCAMWL